MKTCSKCKKPTAVFPITKLGKPSSMCQPCYDWMKSWNAQKDARAKELHSNPPDGQGFCLRCKRLKPSEEFEHNPSRRRVISSGRKESSPLCKACRALNNENTKRIYRAHGSPKREAYLEGRRNYMRGWRDKIIAAYGGVCVCCGETEAKFLELDHIEGNGGKHRREIGFTSEALYRWAEKNNFPATLQVLCANCHTAKTNWGACPHQDFDWMRMVG